MALHKARKGTAEKMSLEMTARKFIASEGQTNQVFSKPVPTCLIF